MILPIIPYGDKILRTKSKDIDKDYLSLKKLINDMFHTMINAHGVGISAVQVNLPINLFIINYDIAYNKTENLNLNNKKKVFINSKIIELGGTNTSQKEGCLSIPTIFENITRANRIKLQYLDENFNSHEEELSDLVSRVVQHEYDHILGKLFIDYLDSQKLKSIERKLDLIKSGKLRGPYLMKY